VPPPGAGVTTVTVAVPASAMSVAGMVAVSWVGETYVVVRFAPFHRTRLAATKFVPVTVSVNVGPPATAKTGFSPVVVGTGFAIVRVCALDVPPPGAGLTTVICAVPAAAMSAAAIAAVSCVAEPYVVARGVPFQRTTEPGMNPLPVTASVNAGPPTVAVAGLRLVTVGTGLGVAASVHVKLSRTWLADRHLAKPTAPALAMGGGMNPGSQKSPGIGCVLLSCTMVPEAKACHAVPSKRSTDPVSVTGLAPTTRRRRR